MTTLRAWRNARKRIRVLEEAIHDYLEGNDNRLRRVLDEPEESTVTPAVREGSSSTRGSSDEHSGGGDFDTENRRQIDGKHA